MMLHKSLLQLSCWSNVCITTGITGLTRAFLVGEKTAEDPHDLQELNTLKLCIKKKVTSKIFAIGNHLSLSV